MLVIVGASASGKTEIANILVSQFSYTKSVTTTTRQKRVMKLMIFIIILFLTINLIV